SVGADVHTAVDVRVTGDGGAAPAPLVLVVVDPCPALARGVGAEDATHSVDPGTGVHRRVVRARGGCPKAHAVAFVAVGDRSEGRTRVRGTPHAVVTVEIGRAHV